MTHSKQLVVIVTGSDSGFGLLTARALAKAGHIVYGGLFRSDDGSYPNYQEFTEESKQNGYRLHGVHLDVTKDDIVDTAIKQVLSDHGRVDAIVHNAGHMALGPAESFSPEQFMKMYDTNCVGCHRLNQAVLPTMRKQKSGLLVWVTSGSVHGPSSPFLAPYFAAKAAQDSLAQTTALEVSQWGIETSIVVPGIFTSGTNHFATAMKPDNTRIEKEYADGPTKGWLEKCLNGSANMGREDVPPQAVGDAIVDIFNAQPGSRPWRVHVEPEGPMAVRTNEVRDKVREEYLTRMGCADLIHVRIR